MKPLSRLSCFLPLLFLALLLPACGQRVALKADDPAYVRSVADRAEKAGGRQAVVDEVNRILRSAGQDMVSADIDGLVERYWEMIGDPAAGAARRQFSRRTYWDEVRRSELWCGGGPGCSLRLLGKGGKRLMEVTGLRDQARGQRLAVLIAVLSKGR